MNRITINNHQVNYTLIGIFGTFIIVPLCLLGMAAYAESDSPGTATAVLIVFVPILLYAGAFGLLDTAKTCVEWDAEKMCITYLKCTRTIRFDDIKQVSYTVYSENRGRAGKQQRLELMFVLDNADNEEYFLNDKLDDDDIGKVISGSGSFPLMKLYSFVADNWTEKAGGYQKSDSR
ncbi:MAG: hypothetical protein IJ874_06450 [Ruminococcus sp.]|nr:hypothetical protein [Ruminococcus sp.]